LKHFILIDQKEYAFKEIYRDFFASQVLFAQNILKGKQHSESEDIVQEVFLKIWRNEPRFKNEIAFKAYLYIATRNGCIDFIRKKKYQLHTIDFAANIEEEANVVLKEEAFRLLDKAVSALAPQSRNIIKLSMQGLSIPEIADALKISVNTVKTLKSRSYRILRDSFGEIFILLLSPFL